MIFTLDNNAKKEVKNTLWTELVSTWTKKRRYLRKALVTSHFPYCPLSLTFHSTNMEDNFNWIHESTSNLAYWSPKLSFDELLVKASKSASIHQRNLKLPDTEIFKVKNEITSLMNNIFQFVKKPYNLRNTDILQVKMIKSIYNGSEAFS